MGQWISVARRWSGAREHAVFFLFGRKERSPACNSVHVPQFCPSLKNLAGGQKKKKIKGRKTNFFILYVLFLYPLYFCILYILVGKKRRIPRRISSSYLIPELSSYTREITQNIFLYKINQIIYRIINIRFLQDYYKKLVYFYRNIYLWSTIRWKKIWKRENEE